jgi:hypothetical protein
MIQLSSRAGHAGVLAVPQLRVQNSRMTCCGRRSPARSARRRTSCPAEFRRWSRTGRCGCPADAGVAADDDMGADPGAVADLDMLADEANRRRSGHPLRRAWRRMDDGGRMDAGMLIQMVRTVHISSASGDLAVHLGRGEFPDAALVAWISTLPGSAGRPAPPALEAGVVDADEVIDRLVVRLAARVLKDRMAAAWASASTISTPGITG